MLLEVTGKKIDNSRLLKASADFTGVTRAHVGGGVGEVLRCAAATDREIQVHQSLIARNGELGRNAGGQIAPAIATGAVGRSGGRRRAG